MHKTVRNAFSVGILASMVLLVGCSGGPSAGDIEDMIKAEMEANTEVLKTLGPVGAAMLKMIPVIHGVELIGCADIRENVYLCNIEVDASIADIRKSRPVEITTAKKNNGDWTKI